MSEQTFTEDDFYEPDNLSKEIREILDKSQSVKRFNSKNGRISVFGLCQFTDWESSSMSRDDLAKALTRFIEERDERQH